jgi:hypothetical protein
MTEYKMKYLIGIILAAFSITASAQTLEARHPGGAVIQLHNEKGPCVNGAKLATYISPDKTQTVPGCWKVSDSAPVISVAWLDGDSTAVPAQAFKPKETM